MTYDREHRNLKLTHIEFRKLIANSLEENVRNGHIHWDSDARGCSIDVWIKKYSKVGCYVGEVFLRLASTFLNRKIVLFPVNPYVQKDESAKKIEILPHNEHCGCKTSENQEYEQQCTLLYYEETYFATPHFQSIRPVAASLKTENEDLKEEQEIVVLASTIASKSSSSVMNAVKSESNTSNANNIKPSYSTTTPNQSRPGPKPGTSTRGRGSSIYGNRGGACQQIMPRLQLLDDEDDDGPSCQKCLQPFWYKSQLHDHLKSAHYITDPERYEKEEREKKLIQLREEQHRTALAQHGHGGNPGGPIIRRRGGTMVRGKYFINDWLTFVISY